MEQAVKPQALSALDESRILDLDVRQDLREGREPFQRIMHARHALAEDGVLRLRAIFEPKPLYGVLAREGFGHWTERLADDDWRVWFYPDGSRAQTVTPAAPTPPANASIPAAGSGYPSTAAAAGSASAPTPRAPSTGKPLHNCGTPRPEPTDMHLLDVRGMEPPEPMSATLEALATLPRGHTLVQINARVPRFLLPELESRGFQYTVRDDQPGVVRVFIRHAEEVPVLDVRILPPREKHPTIFATFDGLEPGASFVILNDHDPVPLRYQFMAERPDAFSWEYLEDGPETWRVRLTRVA